MLAPLGSRDWGCRRSALLSLHRATLMSHLNYAAPAWQPWLAPSRRKEVERLQNKGLRIVSGQLQTTPVEGSRAECGVTSYKTKSDTIVARSMEKAAHLPQEHQKRTAFAEGPPHSTKRSHWRKRTANKRAPSPTPQSARLMTMSRSAWAQRSSTWSVDSSLQAVSQRPPR